MRSKCPAGLWDGCQEDLKEECSIVTSRRWKLNKDQVIPSVDYTK